MLFASAVQIHEHFSTNGEADFIAKVDGCFYVANIDAHLLRKTLLYFFDCPFKNRMDGMPAYSDSISFATVKAKTSPSRKVELGKFIAGIRVVIAVAGTVMFDLETHHVSHHSQVVVQVSAVRISNIEQSFSTVGYLPRSISSFSATSRSRRVGICRLLGGRN